MSEEVPVALRLKAIREDAGIALREMARRLSMAPSTYAHYENPDRFKDEFLPMDIALKIAGATRPEGIRNKILSLAMDSHQLSNQQDIDRVREAAGLFSGGESGAVQKHVDIAPSRVELGEAAPAHLDMVPVFDVMASAGNGSVNEYEPQTHSLAFPPEYLKKLTSSSPGNLAIISVKGDSMEPTLLDDDIVLLDTSKTHLGYDGLFVVRFDDVLHVKRVGRSAKPGHIMIISDNPVFRDLEPRKDDIQAVGKVLWYGRKV